MTGDELPAGPVVVGHDGSESADAALDLAVREAQWHRRPVSILTALEWPYVEDAIDSWTQPPAGPSPRERAEHNLEAAVHRVQAIDPDLPVDGRVEVGGAAAALVEASGRAAMVVVGAHGSSRLASVVAGSVPVQVATHAAGIVVVVRGHSAPGAGAQVAVGTDGSSHEGAALAFSLLEASTRGVGLQAIRAWRHPVATGGDLLPRLVAQHQASEEAAAAASLGPYAARYPELKTDLLAVRGSAARALLDASAHSQLVVVGARGHGGFTGLLLGSVGLNLIHHAACPVAIVH